MGRPRLIILVRHGESESNCDKSINQYVPNHKIPLTPGGCEQARAAGKRLRDILLPNENVLIYTSPYRRTRETTQEILSQLDGVECRVYEEPRLREQDFGNFQQDEANMAKIWKERARYGHFFYRIPNGESAADVYDRCAGFNETLFRQFSSDKFAKVLVLVTHGLMTRVFLMKWYRWTVERFESLRNVNYCEFVTMELQESGKYLLKNKMRTWADPPLTQSAGSNSGNKKLEEKQDQIRKMFEEVQDDSLTTLSPSVSLMESGLSYAGDSKDALIPIESIDSDSLMDGDYTSAVLDDEGEAAENGICLMRPPKTSNYTKSNGP
ncbi:histidine phosphatase superfamily [Lipomyces arxii]|uniref:histidine phosphatase superfamily n=1 Tax=Lipomyces arxii TaxID=56418 RepID=UPI0034CE13B3